MEQNLIMFQTKLQAALCQQNNEPDYDYDFFF